MIVAVTRLWRAPSYLGLLLCVTGLLCDSKHNVGAQNQQHGLDRPDLLSLRGRRAGPRIKDIKQRVGFGCRSKQQISTGGEGEGRKVVRRW